MDADTSLAFVRFHAWASDRILTNVVHHGTRYRSELARLLTECGHSPGDLDLLDALEPPWPSSRDCG